MWARDVEVDLVALFAFVLPVTNSTLQHRPDSKHGELGLVS